MKIHFTSLNIIFLTLYLTLVKADDCFELYSKYNSEISYTKVIEECDVNSSGKVTNLQFNCDGKASADDINRIFSYGSLRKLYYNDDTESYIDDDKALLNFSIPSENLTNLEDLKLAIDRYQLYSGLGGPGSISIQRGKILKNGFKPLKNLKKLSLLRIEISQDNIDEISNLPNFEELEIKECIIKELDLKPLKSLKSLSIINTELSDNNINDIAKLTNLKKLKISKYLTNEVIDGISNLTNLEELILSPENTKMKFKPIQKLNNLKHLELIPESIFDWSIRKYINGNFEFEKDAFINFKNFIKIIKLH